MSTLPVETLKVGDRIRVANLNNNGMYNGTVVALYEKERAISVDVRKGKRIYFRSAYMNEWMLYDLAERITPTKAQDVDLELE